MVECQPLPPDPPSRYVTVTNRYISWGAWLTSIQQDISTNMVDDDQLVRRGIGAKIKAAFHVRLNLFSLKGVGLDIDYFKLTIESLGRRQGKFES